MSLLIRYSIAFILFVFQIYGKFGMFLKYVFKYFYEECYFTFSIIHDRGEKRFLFFMMYAGAFDEFLRFFVYRNDETLFDICVAIDTFVEILIVC